MARRISAIIALDGEKEFKQAVTNVNKELTNLKSQSKLTKEEFAGQANTLNALSAKHELLSKILDTHKKKEKELQKGLDHAREAYEKYGTDLEKLKSTYKSATEKMQQMESSSKATKKQLETQRKEVERLAEGIRGSEERYQTAANRIQDWESKLNTARAQTIKANKELEQNKKYLDEAEHATDKCAKSIDEYGKKVKETTEATLGWEAALKGALAGDVAGDMLDGVKELGTSALETAKDMDAAQKQIQASTGASALSMQAYKDVLEDVYKKNYGDNFTDVANAISLVNQNMDSLSKNDLQSVTEGALTLRDTFDMDLNETIRGTDALVKNMGVDANEALDLIAKGAQNGLNKSGELGDNIAEYSQLWGQAGFSAEKMFAILDNGLKSGAYNLDKVNDFVKEFTISLSDGRMQEGIENFSLGTQTLFYQWQEGGATAAQVFESVIADLAGMKNQQDALTIASNTWSALGEDNAMKVITSLNNVNDTYKNVEGTMSSIQNIKYDDVTSQLTETARIIQMKIAEPLAKDWLPKINKGLEFVGDNIEVISAASLGLGTLITIQRAKETKIGNNVISMLKKIFIAKQAETIATEAGTAATAKRTVTSLANTAATAKQAAATKLLAAQQAAYNAVASLTPMGKAALIIGGTVAAYKALQYAIVETDEELVKNREEVAELCDEYDNLKSSVESAAQGRKETIDGITAEYMGYQSMTEKLINLAEEENKTSGQMALMREYVSQLNEAMPSLNLAIDEQTGKLNLSTDAIYDQIDALKEKAQTAAYEDMLKELLEEEAKAEIELAKLEEERDDVLERRKELQDELNEKLKLYENVAGASSGVTIYYSLKIRELNKQIEELDEGISGCNEIIENSQNAFNIAAEKIGEVTEKARAATGETDNLGTASEGAAAKTQDATQEQAAAYQELKESIQSNIQQTVSILDEFSGGEKKTTDEILSNLKSQIEGTNKWADNMKLLGGAAGEGMTQEFYNYLAEMGPESANMVQELVDTLQNDTEKFTELCNTWTEAMNLDENWGEQVASGYKAMETEIANGSSTVKSQAEKAHQEVTSSITQKNIIWSKQNEETMRAAMRDQIKAESEELTVGASTVFAASQTVATAVLEPMKSAIAQAQGQGYAISTQTAQGINAGAPLAIQAAQNLASTIQQALATATQAATKPPASAPPASGTSNAQPTSNPKGSGIKMAVPPVLTQDQNKEGQILGANIVQGITTGILSQVSGVKASMAQVCDEVFNEAKTDLDIHSPSKKFKKDIGEMISKGVAFGIEAKKGQAIKKSKELADDVYWAATTWMTDYKKKNETTLEDEKYFWQQLSKTVKKGTESYKDAQKKVKKIKDYQKTVNTKTKKKFGVSEYDDKGAKKSAENYYNDIYQAANKYFSDYSALHSVSLQQEEYYWEKVLAKLKKGTQGYTEAKKQLKQVQTQIKEQVAAGKEANKEYALSGGALDAYKTYYKVSLNAEMEYWKEVRKKFKKGTKERIEADQKYYEAKAAYNEKLEELNEEYYENCKEVNERLNEEVQSLTDSYKDAVAERKASIYDSVGLFDQFTSTSVSGSTLLYNLKTQVAGIADWEQQLSKLGNKGILSSGLMQELADMGPQASASLHALSQLSDEQLREYEALWEQKNALAEAQAVKENEQLRQQTQAQIDALKTAAQEEINAYSKAYEAAVAEVKAPMEKSLKDLAGKATKMGEDAIAALIAGYKDKATAKETKADIKKVNNKISSQLGKLEQEGKTIGDNTLQGILDGLNNRKKINSSAKSMVDALKKAIQKEADIHSPSRLFKREVGAHIATGVAVGIEGEQKTVNRAGTEMIHGLIKQQSAEMARRQQELQSYASSVCNTTGIAELNRLISVAPVQQVTAQVDNTNMLVMLQEMIGIMQEGFTQMANMQIVTDTGALIGETSTGMSEQLAASWRRMRR